MLLTYFLNDFEIVPVAPIVIIIIMREITKFTNLEVSRHYPLVLRVKVGW